jgi:hypothetical protein
VGVLVPGNPAVREEAQTSGEDWASFSLELPFLDVGL